MSYAAWLTTTTPYEPSGLNSSVWSSSRRDSTVPAASVQRTPSGSTGTALGGTGAVPVTGHAQSSQLLTIRSAASGRSNLDSTTARGCACPMYHASSGRRCPGGSVKLLQTGEQHDGSAAAAPVRVEITEPVCLHRIGQESENLLERAELGGYRGGTGRADVPLGDVREPGPVVLQRLGQPRFGAGLLVVGDRQMSHDQPPPAVQVRERIVPRHLIDLVSEREDADAVILPVGAGRPEPIAELSVFDEISEPEPSIGQLLRSEETGPQIVQRLVRVLLCEDAPGAIQRRRVGAYREDLADAQRLLDQSHRVAAWLRGEPDAILQRLVQADGLLLAQESEPARASLPEQALRFPVRGPGQLEPARIAVHLAAHAPRQPLRGSVLQRAPDADRGLGQFGGVQVAAVQPFDVSPVGLDGRDFLAVGLGLAGRLAGGQLAPCGGVGVVCLSPLASVAVVKAQFLVRLSDELGTVRFL